MKWGKKVWVKLLIIFGIILLIYFFGLPMLSHYLQSRFLSTAPKGNNTPETYGVSYERIKIKSDNRYLDSYLVVASSKNQLQNAVLIFHGADETISNWAKVQKSLYDNGISSLVFDYSGFGYSSPPASIKNLNLDALSAYTYFASRFKGNKLFVLGFSLGNAPMLASILNFKPAPSGVIIGSAFSSLRELGLYSGKTTDFRKALVKVIPDVWNNTKAIKENTAPLLVLHSDTDFSNPLFMGKKIFASACEPKQFVLLHGLKHNAPISDSSMVWWVPVIDFIKNMSNK